MSAPLSSIGAPAYYGRNVEDTILVQNITTNGSVTIVSDGSIVAEGIKSTGDITFGPVSTGNSKTKILMLKTSGVGSGLDLPNKKNAVSSIVVENLKSSGSVNISGNGSIVAKGITTGGDFVLRSGPAKDIETLTTSLKFLNVEKKQPINAAKEVAKKTDAIMEKVKQSEDDSDDNSCVICLVGPRKVIIVDCGHLAYCLDCIKTINACAICRKPITNTVVVYNA